MVGKGFDGRLGNEDVYSFLDGIESYGMMCWVWCEDCDGITWRESINCRLVRIWVADIALGEGVKGGIKAIVNLGDILLQMLA
jgi:hypothetical protein